ncbi:MAG TPA: BatA and WFA domain-containing protein, partial [Bacillota bacterium]|nr:BatA and WFA domain-containing protein [Bacillota bacterium]
MLNLAMSGALWLLLTLIPVVFFYFLRTRFRQQPVSSVYIWSRLADNLRGRNQIRKRSLWLLILQIITVLAAVLAVAQPFWLKQHLAQPGTVFLVDVSASMAAVDDSTGTSRLTRACQALEAELAKLPRGTKTRVFLCDQDAVPLGESETSSRTILRRLQQVTVRGGEFNETEVTQKLQAWLNSQKQPWQACLISDGGLDLGGQQISRLFEGAFKFIPVGTESTNLGLAGLRFINPAMVQFSVNNGSLTKQSVTVVLEAEHKVIGEINLKVPSGLSRHVLKLRQRFGPGVYTIRFKNHQDALAMDDRYFLAVNPLRKVRVLLAGESNPFLAAAFRHPGIELTQWRRLPTRGFTGAEWDLIVIDRVPIPVGIKTNLLAFNRIPPGSSSKLSPLTPGVMRTADTAHPLLRFVDWQQVRITAGNSIRNAAGAQILAYVNRQPLIAVWEKQHYRTVVV